MEFILKGGFMMWPLLACSIAALTIFIERFLYLNKIKVDSESLMSRIRELINVGKIDLAISTCQRVNTPLSRILLAAIKNHGKDEEVIKSYVEHAALNEMPELEKYIPTLGMIAQIAPLLGFLGTVTGMIKSFKVVASQGLGNNPEALAGGIAEALITTATGLFVAIPTVVVYHYLSNKIDNLMLDIEKRSMEIINILEGK
jgi:biopolymer transport protein ExbB